MTRCSSVVNRSRHRLARGARLRRLLAVIVDGCYGGSDEEPAMALPAALLGRGGREGWRGGSGRAVRARPLAQDAAHVLMGWSLRSARCGGREGVKTSVAALKGG